MRNVTPRASRQDWVGFVAMVLVILAMCAPVWLAIYRLDHPANKTRVYWNPDGWVPTQEAPMPRPKKARVVQWAI